MWAAAGRPRRSRTAWHQGSQVVVAKRYASTTAGVGAVAGGFVRSAANNTARLGTMTAYLPDKPTYEQIRAARIALGAPPAEEFGVKHTGRRRKRPDDFRPPR